MMVMDRQHCLTCDGEGRVECTRGYYEHQGSQVVQAERYPDGWYIRCRDCNGSGDQAEDPDRDSIDQLGLRGVVRTL